MDKAQYVELEFKKQTTFWGRFALVAGAIVFMALSVLDYFITPENFFRFLVYRAICSSLMVILFLIHRKYSDYVIQKLVIVASAILTSITIELMILSFGGHTSSYYAGIIITIVFMLGVVPLTFNMAIVVVCIAYSIYLLPILAFDTITNVSVFINNNAFLLATFGIALIWRFLGQKNLTKQFELQYDLEQERNKLRMYSSELETLVQERTKELSISEKWYRSIFDNATDGILILDRNGLIINVNQKTCEITGRAREDLIGAHIDEIEGKGSKETRESQLSNLHNSESLIYEMSFVSKEGKKVVVEVSSKIIVIAAETYIQSFYRDVTEKKNIHEQLMHSQKMESIGILAGGIAHNFNNILTAILGYSEILLEFGNLDEKSREKVHGIERSARKAGVMVGQMLRFARREAHEMLPTNLHDVISETVKLFEGASNKNIQLKVDLETNVPIIYGDPNQIEQIIMNLLVNAKDAMPDGGVITILTRLINVEIESHSVPKYILPGRYIKLSVSDMGAGIPDEIVNKIFDPFFTTKQRGKGTGLGLATVYGIVKDHKGYVSVQSIVGVGTTFDIYLPVGRVIAGQSMKQDA